MITKEEVESHIEQFNKDYGLGEETLKELFAMKDSREIIMARVLVLDRLYSTGLKDYEPEKDKKQVVWAEKLALYIYKHNDVICASIKRALESDGDSQYKFADDAIKEIMRVSFESSDGIETDEKQYDLVYSFATKYCSFKAPSVFAIYDSKINRFLTKDIKEYFGIENKKAQYTLQAKSFDELRSKKEYQNLLKTMNGLLKDGKVSSLFDKAPSVKELDSFIWQLEKTDERKRMALPK